jgi:hypothetical protein
MTWLSIVTASSFSFAVAGLAVLATLGISLRTQGGDTEKQVWNRRMLAIGTSLYAVALLLPYLVLGELLHSPLLSQGSVLAIPEVALGLLVSGMVVLHRQGRVMVTLIFLAVGLIPSLLMPVHRGPYVANGFFFVTGLLLAKLTRVAIRRNERKKQLH